MVKNPRKPLNSLTHTDAHVIDFQSTLWRIHRTQGTHVRRWDRLRDWGPDVMCRFDPHPPPPSEQPNFAVMYAGCDLRTAVIEVFQGKRRVDTRSGDPTCIAWAPTRVLRLLHLSAEWCLANGASASLPSANRNICRNWAHAIRVQFPTLDGLFTDSTMTGCSTVVLFSPAANSFPPRPEFARFLDSSEMVAIIAQELKGTNFTLI